MLYHLTYISNSKEPFSDECFAKLLLQGRKSNAAHNITGILLYLKGNFIQYIEGPEEQIHSLFDKIKTDDRHSNVQVISESEIAKRSFQDWNLEYQTFSEGELEQMVGCNDITTDPEAIKRTVKLVKLFSPRLSYSMAMAEVN